MTSSKKTNPQVSLADKHNIEKLFKQGLDAALKDPEKFWDAQRDREAKTKPYSKLAQMPLIQLASKSQKKESLAVQLRGLLLDVEEKK